MNIDRKIKLLKDLKKSLLNNKISIGSWIQIPSSNTAEIMSFSGYEWIAVDMEHGQIEFNQLPDIFRALELGDTLPLVRVKESNTINCSQALDAGAMGVILPNILSKDQLEKIIHEIIWPPKGSRGVGFCRANLYGRNFIKYKQIAENILIIPMIENIKSIENLEEILSLKQISAIFIGPYDLSASLGIAGDFQSKEFKKTIKYIKKICKKNNIPVGIHVVHPSKKDLTQRIKEGFKFIAYSTDSIFLENYSVKPNDLTT